MIHPKAAGELLRPPRLWCAPIRLQLRELSFVDSRQDDSAFFTTTGMSHLSGAYQRSRAFFRTDGWLEAAYDVTLSGGGKGDALQHHGKFENRLVSRLPAHIVVYVLLKQAFLHKYILLPVPLPLHH